MKKLNELLKESSIDKKIKLKLKSLTEDLETEVDKETWSEPKEEQDKEISNNDDIEIDGEAINKSEFEAAPMSALDYLTKDKSELEPGEPEVLTEFDELTNEEKKALLLKLAKDDVDLNTLLKDYLEKKSDNE